MSSEYRGETDAKRRARHFLFTCALPRECPRLYSSLVGYAVILAGDGGDLRMLRALGWPASKIVCVDQDASCVSRAREIWPEVDSKLGDIRREVLALPRASIGLAVLDFCGHMNAAVMETVKLIGHRMRVDGCISVTYLRGREGLHTPVLREAREIRREIETVSGRTWPPSLEMEGNRRAYGSIVGQWLHESWSAKCHVRFQTRAWIDYHSGSSPMGILLMQVMQATSRSSPNMVKADGMGLDEYGGLAPAFKVPKNEDHLAAIRAHVLERSAMRAADLADCWNLPSSRVAAWRAVATMQARSARDIGRTP